MNILNKFLNGLINVFTTLLNFILSILPDSPFANVNINFLNPILGNINWFIPLDRIIITLTIWGTAVLIYYLYTVIMRFTKVID